MPAVPAAEEAASPSEGRAPLVSFILGDLAAGNTCAWELLLLAILNRYSHAQFEGGRLPTSLPSCAQCAVHGNRRGGVPGSLPVPREATTGKRRPHAHCKGGKAAVTLLWCQEMSSQSRSARCRRKKICVERHRSTASPTSFFFHHHQSAVTSPFPHPKKRFTCAQRSTKKPSESKRAKRGESLTKKISEKMSFAGGRGCYK